MVAESVCRHAESISNDGRSSTLSIQDPSKLGSFDLESLSDVAGYGIRQRSFALVKVPVSRGKGSWRRPFSLFLEFYLSGVGYLRLRRGIRRRGYNTGRGKIRQDVERSSSVTATKFRPQSLKESLVSQQPTVVQLSCILSCSLLFSWQSRELWLRHARRAANARDGQRSKKTKRQMRRNVELWFGQGYEEKTDKVIISFYLMRKRSRKYVPMRTHSCSWFGSLTGIDSSAMLFHHSKRETVCVLQVSFKDLYNTTHNYRNRYEELPEIYEKNLREEIWDITRKSINFN